MPFSIEDLSSLFKGGAITLASNHVHAIIEYGSCGVSASHRHFFIKGVPLFRINVVVFSSVVVLFTAVCWLEVVASKNVDGASN